MRRMLIAAMVSTGLWNLAHGAAPNFISAQTAPDGGIIIRWSSEPDKIYRIDYAPELTTPMQWRELYTDYPSQGPETFWKDVGNEFAFPPASHPQEGPMRFYRVAEIGANTASKPTASITSPAQGATVSDTITVSLSISSGIPVDHVRLFVDGGEAGLQPDSATEFTLNTYEFPNGQRTLLAVVRNFSGGGATGEASTFVENVAPSALRTLTFDNYIRASKRLLAPELSETSKFVAKFAAYSDWTLTIKNSSGVAVRTVTGTDFRLNFVWDGRGDGGAVLPNGYYTATLSAEPSAQPPPAPGGGGGGPLPSPGGQSAMMLSDGSLTYFMKPPPMPPYKTNGIYVPWEDVFGPLPLTQLQFPHRF